MLQIDKLACTYEQGVASYSKYFSGSGVKFKRNILIYARECIFLLYPIRVSMVFPVVM